MLLDRLPIELLPNIFANVPADDLWRNLRAVNRDMSRIIKRPNYWLKRANRRYGLVIPERLKNGGESTTVEGEGPSNSGNNNVEVRPQADEHSTLMPIYRCIATERTATWCENGGLANSVHKMDAHLGTIDALRLFKANQNLFCLSGARDHQIRLWDMQSATNQENPAGNANWAHTTVDAHDGWVWSISPTEGGQQFFSAGWDSQVKQWQVADAAILPILHIQTGVAALCCLSEGPHLVYVSTYRDGPLLFDTRVGPQPQAVQNCHGRKPVIELATGPDSHKLFSIGDDCHLAAVDKRQFQRVANTFQTPNTISHLDYAEGQLCLSLRDGHLLFFDPDSLRIENELAITEAPPRGHQNIRVTAGATFCAFSDNVLRVFSPGLRPRPLADGIVELFGTVTRMDVLGGHIVAALDMGSLRYWPVA